MKFLRRLKRHHVNPYDGRHIHKGTKGKRIQIIVKQGSLSNLCALYSTHTISHSK